MCRFGFAGLQQACEVIVLVDLQHPALENFVLPFRQQAEKEREQGGRLEGGLPLGEGEADGRAVRTTSRKLNGAR